MIVVYLSFRSYKGSKKRHYFLRYLDPATGKMAVESCRCTDAKQAEQIRQKKYRELNGLEPKAPIASSITVEEIRDLTVQYMTNRDRAAGSIYLCRRAFDRMVEFLASRNCRPQAEAVTAEMVEGLVSYRLSQGVKGRTVNREIGNLRSGWNIAMRLKKLTCNPFNDFEKVSVDPVTITPITAAEEQAMLDAAAHDLELTCWVRLLLDTGCRANEVSHLRWTDLSLDSGIGKVETRADWRSKTRRHRPIAFTPETAVALRQWRLRRKGHDKLFGEDDAGIRDHYRSMFDQFKKAVKNAKITRKITPQDCRRSLGTLLARRGVNQRVASEILGHSSIQTTARYYQAVDPETVHSVIVDIRKKTG